MAISFIAPLVICPLVALPGRRLIGDLRRARAELDFAVSQDSLTGLLSRRGFEAAATARLEACQLEDLPVAAFMCDVDYFKSINDRFGHEFGDSALERIASMIESSLEDQDAVIGRLGGEEFAVLVPDCDLAQGEKLAGAIRSACEALSVNFGVSSSQITLSVGVAAVDKDDETLRLLLSRADAALYQAKRDGRNRVCVAPNRKPLSIAA
jgi:diguanylate cyclase (GGDEF)-like protein